MSDKPEPVFPPAEPTYQALNLPAGLKIVVMDKTGATLMRGDPDAATYREGDALGVLLSKGWSVAGLLPIPGGFWVFLSPPAAT